MFPFSFILFFLKVFCICVRKRWRLPFWYHVTVSVLTWAVHDSLSDLWGTVPAVNFGRSYKAGVRACGYVGPCALSFVNRRGAGGLVCLPRSRPCWTVCHRTYSPTALRRLTPSCHISGAWRPHCFHARKHSFCLFSSLVGLARDLSMLPVAHLERPWALSCCLFHWGLLGSLLFVSLFLLMGRSGPPSLCYLQEEARPWTGDLFGFPIETLFSNLPFGAAPVWPGRAPTQSRTRAQRVPCPLHSRGQRLDWPSAAVYLPWACWRLFVSLLGAELQACPLRDTRCDVCTQEPRVGVGSGDGLRCHLGLPGILERHATPALRGPWWRLFVPLPDGGVTKVTAGLSQKRKSSDASFAEVQAGKRDSGSYPNCDPWRPRGGCVSEWQVPTQVLS